jgi:hypothetical protein
MKAFIVCLSSVVLATSVYAVDDPTVEEGDQHFNAQMCINQVTNDCVTTSCLNSEERDCIDKCKAGAEDKCAEDIVGQ